MIKIVANEASALMRLPLPEEKQEESDKTDKVLLPWESLSSLLSAPYEVTAVLATALLVLHTESLVIGCVLVFRR